ncbi:MAG: DUF721 domain-containing protein [Gammaproteobacteria bacterium]
MPIKTPKRIAGLLAGSHDILQPLLARAKRLEQLNHALRSQLPPPLNQHCQVANIRGDTLVLHADSSAWALKLRYSVPVMLAQLQKQPALQHLRGIDIKVRPASIAAAPAEKPRRAHMSGDTASLLDSMADAIAHPRLQAALHRLARHGKQR